MRLGTQVQGRRRVRNFEAFARSPGYPLPAQLARFFAPLSVSSSTAGTPLRSPPFLPTFRLVRPLLSARDRRNDNDPRAAELRRGRRATSVTRHLLRLPGPATYRLAHETSSHDSSTPFASGSSPRSLPLSLARLPYGPRWIVAVVAAVAMPLARAHRRSLPITRVIGIASLFCRLRLRTQKRCRAAYARVRSRFRASVLRASPLSSSSSPPCRFCSCFFSPLLLPLLRVCLERVCVCVCVCVSAALLRLCSA